MRTRKAGVMDLSARTRTELVVNGNAWRTESAPKEVHGENNIMKQSAWRTGQQERSTKWGSDRACMAWSPGFHNETGCRGAELSSLNRRTLRFESQNSQV